MTLVKFLNIRTHYNRDVCVITSSDSVAWIQLFNLYCMESNTCIDFITCIGKSWIQPVSFNNTRNTGKTRIQIVRQLPVIAGWLDVPLAPEDLAEAISIIKLRAPHRFQTQIS